MPFLTTAITTIAAVSSVALAAPLAIPVQPRQTSDAACVNGRVRLHTPELFNIYHYPGVTAFPATSTVLNIMNGSNTGSAQDQVARWANLPSDIADCTFGWSQAAERSFSVYDNGLVRFSQLSGLPADNVTADTIAPYQTSGARNGSIDFTFWPEIPGPATHTGGPVDCGSEVVVQLKKDVVNGGPGSVTLQQDNQNGLWLEHSC